jgi:hypothetical protein
MGAIANSGGSDEPKHEPLGVRVRGVGLNSRRLLPRIVELGTWRQSLVDAMAEAIDESDRDLQISDGGRGRIAEQLIEREIRNGYRNPFRKRRINRLPDWRSVDICRFLDHNSTNCSVLRRACTMQNDAKSSIPNSSLRRRDA